MAKPFFCDLKSCYMCQACLSDWRQAIGNVRENIAIRKGQALFKEGGPVNGMYFVYSGKLKVHKRWGNERELILRFAKSGDIVGHLGLGDKPEYPVSATALTDVSVCYVPMEFFESTLNVNSSFTIKLMRFFANELQESEKRMNNLVHMSVKGRIVQALLTLQNQFGLNEDGCIDIEITRQDLASFSGSVYESVFRALNDLTAKGIVAFSGKYFIIKDPAGLQGMMTEKNP